MTDSSLASSGDLFPQSAGERRRLHQQSGAAPVDSLCHVQAPNCQFSVDDLNKFLLGTMPNRRPEHVSQCGKLSCGGAWRE